ncbi:hypothetical protein LC586_30915 [Nostoc sp. CHAB 5714]|uniref:Transposase n=1 Tax=Nostoc favosum CHAB5714 TaxID=2780399 RepID=A0ABS8IGV5_9NOSO|nr:hypothetical protein [Nostoc favosum]MCC5603475.1 hypothetical protein [Nostoc favosum CHAB5714]
MLNEIIIVYAIIDDLLKAIRHSEDCRREMSYNGNNCGNVLYVSSTKLKSHRRQSR